MIADKFKITPAEANGTYETLVSMFNKDGRLPPKIARGYLDLLRQERSVPADFDPQKFLDFSMLPAATRLWDPSAVHSLPPYSVF